MINKNQSLTGLSYEKLIIKFDRNLSVFEIRKLSSLRNLVLVFKKTKTI